MQTVIGMEVQNAVALLKRQGFECEIKTYESRRPVEADTARVVAQRKTGGRTVKLVVCGFKTNV